MLNGLSVSQFATAQEELLRLLSDFIKILDSKVLSYAVDIKVQLYGCNKHVGIIGCCRMSALASFLVLRLAKSRMPLFHPS